MEYYGYYNKLFILKNIKIQKHKRDIITADYDNFVQKQPGTEIIFREVNIVEAEKLFNEYLIYKKKQKDLIQW